MIPPNLAIASLCRAPVSPRGRSREEASAPCLDLEPSSKAPMDLDLAVAVPVFFGVSRARIAARNMYLESSHGRP